LPKPFLIELNEIELNANGQATDIVPAYIVLRADIKPIVDGETARCAASPSISGLTYLRIAISTQSL